MAFWDHLVSITMTLVGCCSLTFGSVSFGSACSLFYLLVYLVKLLCADIFALIVFLVQLVAPLPQIRIKLLVKRWEWCPVPSH